MLGVLQQAKVAIGFEVARAVAAARPKDTIYIVKYAPGGTALADQWDLSDSWKGYGAYAAIFWVAPRKAFSCVTV